MHKMNRREFLQTLALLPGLASPAFLHSQGGVRPQMLNDSKPNILILLFDAFSAQHASLYGYARDTTPNFVRFADKSTVYHQHLAAGSFTNPGTGSLLTGTYPWTHRSTSLYAPTLPEFEKHNVFNLFADYHTIAYTHNLVAHLLLAQFIEDADTLIPIEEFCLTKPNLPHWFFKDKFEIAELRERLWFGPGTFKTRSTSWLFQMLARKQYDHKIAALREQYQDQYPLGLPGLFNYDFLFADVIDWLISSLDTIPEPYFGYFHFIPPHGPYNPRKEFVDLFNDEWVPQPKPRLTYYGGLPEVDLNRIRGEYDRFVAHTDWEFGRLMTALEDTGMFEDTYIILTSDHGEMFERGYIGHGSGNPSLYDPAVHIPLVVHAPGQTQRKDVHTTTSAIDILPTLLHVTDREIPAWCEGQILPGFGEDTRVSDSSVYTFEARDLPKRGPVNQATLSLSKGLLKLIHYHGYVDGPDTFELYNLADDPGEMVNLYDEGDSEIKLMREELQEQLHSIGKTD